MDGKIQLSELKGGEQGPATMLKKYFALIDANHDGALDAKELEAASKLMQQQRRRPPAQAAQPAPAAPAAATPAASQ
jgi:hypothetical protein